MAVYSVNQVRQMYVADGLGTTSTHVTTIANNGEMGVFSTGTGNEKEMYFKLKNLKTGEMTISDRIALKNLDRVEVIPSTKMAIPMRKISISLASGVNSGAPVAGQDYVLGINFKNFYSDGDDSQYYKNVAVHVTSAMDNAEKLFTAMVAELNKAFAREDGATASSNPYLAFSVSGSTSSAKLVIEEKAQPWTLGTKKQRRILFDVFPSTIYTGGDDVMWAKQETNGNYFKEESSTTSVKNGKAIADLEWFCMGERGDQYRGMGWPKYIPTEYSVDASKTYSLIEIHYAFTDSGVNSYRTEKEITIAIPDSTTTDHEYDKINALIDEIEYHTGLTIAGIS